MRFLPDSSFVLTGRPLLELTCMLLSPCWLAATRVLLLSDLESVELQAKLCPNCINIMFLTFHKILTSRRVLEGEDRQKQTEQARFTLGLGSFFSLWAIAYGHSSELPP